MMAIWPSALQKELSVSDLLKVKVWKSLVGTWVSFLGAGSRRSTLVGGQPGGAFCLPLTQRDDDTSVCMSEKLPYIPLRTPRALRSAGSEIPLLPQGRFHFKFRVVSVAASC